MRERFAGPITLIANSMGGAIVRAFLAYSTDAGTGAAGFVDSVFFLQGAQQGSHLAYAKPFAQVLLLPAGIGREMVFAGMSELVREATGWDASRPAIDDLRPFFSETYRFVNPSPAHIPDHIAYFNVASEIRWSTRVDLIGVHFGIPWRWARVENDSGSLGDYVILPGSDDPTALPPLGGARLLPSTIGRGADSAQWILDREVETQMEVIVEWLPTAPFVDRDFDLPDDPLHVAESHLELGGVDAHGNPRMHEISVRDRISGLVDRLDQVLLREIARLDQR